MKSWAACKPLLFTLAALLPAEGSAAPSSMDLLNQASAELDGYREVLAAKSSAQSVAECALGFGENPELAVAMAEKNVRIRFSERISGSALGTWTLVIKGEEQISNAERNLNKSLSSRSQDEISAKVLPPIVFDRVSVNQNLANGGTSYLAGVCGKAGLKELKYAEFKYFYEEALSRWQRAFSENDRVEILRLGTALEAFMKNTSIFRDFPASVRVFNENLMFPLRKKIAQVQRVYDGAPRVVIIGNLERVKQAEGYVRSIFPGAQIETSATTEIKVDQMVFAPFPEIRNLVAGVMANVADKKAKQAELRELVSEDLKIALTERRDFQYYIRKVKRFFAWRHSPRFSGKELPRLAGTTMAQVHVDKAEPVTEKNIRAVAGPLKEKHVLVKSGDSVLGLCLKNRISLSKFLRLNPSLKGDPDRVLAGQRVRVK